MLDQVPSSETWDTPESSLFRGLVPLQGVPQPGGGAEGLAALPHGPPAEAELLLGCSPGTRSLGAPSHNGLRWHRPPLPVGRTILCHGLCIVGRLQHPQPHPPDAGACPPHISRRCQMSRGRGGGEITSVRTLDWIWLSRADFMSLLQGAGSPDPPCALAASSPPNCWLLSAVGCASGLCWGQGQALGYLAHQLKLEALF